MGTSVLPLPSNRRSIGRSPISLQVPSWQWHLETSQSLIRVQRFCCWRWACSVWPHIVCHCGGGKP